MSDMLHPHSRRHFLSRLGLAACASQCGTPWTRADEAPTGLTLGYSTYGLKAQGPIQAAQWVAAEGFDSLELAVRPGWGADPPSLNPGQRKDLAQRLRDTGLRLPALMDDLKIEADPARHQQTLERLRQVAAWAHELVPEAPPLLESTLGGGTWEKVKGLYAERLADWAKVARENDLVVAIKPHRFGAMNQPAHAAELLQGLGRPGHLRMAYDYSHYDLRELPLEDTLQTALPWLAFVAVKDVKLVDGKAVFLLPGEGGRIDYPKLLRLLWAGGYRGDINCEVSGMVWNRKDYDPRAALRTCYRNLSTAFAKAAVPRLSRR